jgi:hypothetical protein
MLVGLYFLAVFAFACFECTLPLLLGSSKFHPDELTRPGELIERLDRGERPVEEHVRDLLSSQSLDRLRAAVDQGDRAARLALLRELNPLLETEAFYAAPHWADVELREETRELAGGEENRGRRMRFNRLLLEDAFPELIRCKPFYFDETRIGFLFAYCGLVSAFVQGGMIGRLVKRFGEPRLIAVSLLGVGISLAMMPFAVTLLGLLLVLALIAGGSGVNRAPTLGLLSIITPASEQGATMGVVQSAGTLGRIFGPLFALGLYEKFPHVPYVAGAAICILAAGLAMKFLKRPETSPA